MTTKLCFSLLLLSLSVSADDLETADFSLRFPTALSHFSPFGDVSGKGGTGAASISGAALNPAALSWHFQDNPITHPKFKDPTYLVTGQYNGLSFDAGQQIDFFTQAVVLDLADAGVLRFSFANATSNDDALIRGFPVTFDLDLTGGRLDWALKLHDDLRFGLGGSYSQSETTFSAPSFDAIHTDREYWSLRSGLVASVHEEDKVLLGVVADFGQGRNDTLEQLPDPATGQLLRQREMETVNQFLIRPGVARSLDKHNTSWAHLDYEFSHISSPSGTLNSHRFLLGADYLLFDLFHVRGGVFADARGNAGWSGALGFHFPNNMHIDLAYQANAFPEVSQEFGRAQTINVSVAFQW